uniref:Serine/threonine/dual specificity protein kinase, catalytic domain-containing protein n=1 Tax=Tanacetum cinerariifolium TaxID=118510 RepID=A0A699KYQ4_TANCI|nr:serine/threonine/dual specificity protein kinase, catalytic domain-containing protein [Tanacetum cinerariifolium]
MHKHQTYVSVYELRNTRHTGWVYECYKGEYDFPAEIVVEIKRSNMDFNQGAIEFWAEIEMFSKFRHSYIIFLLGYCEESGEKKEWGLSPMAKVRVLHTS